MRCGAASSLKRSRRLPFLSLWLFWIGEDCQDCVDVGLWANRGPVIFEGYFEVLKVISRNVGACKMTWSRRETDEYEDDGDA